VLYARNRRTDFECDIGTTTGADFFAIDDIYHHLFKTNKITLQALFEAAAPNIVPVADDCEYKL
jgi:hypothetical protein